MQCPKCGLENPDDVQLCRSCSWVLTSTSTLALAPDARTSKLAIASLVLVILSFFTFFITAIPAFILGLVGLFKIERSGGQLKGKGLAIAGIAVPGASLLFMVPIMIMMAILMPALVRVRTTAHRMVCSTNMCGLGKAMCIYANDYNDKYPTTSKWCDLLIEHTEVTESIFRCKGAREGPCNYAMNETIEKLGIEAPPDMVLLFESYPGWNQSGGPEILSTENHSGEGCNILFNDGCVRFVKPEEIPNLKWTAKQNR